MKWDFAGYVTKNDVQCTDGRVIKHGAFNRNNGCTVPLVWHHKAKDDPSNILGKVLLEERNDGVYGYAKFNNTDKAKLAKELVEHGDITSMSISANSLKHQGCNVVEGNIAEVSLVTVGANSGATIDSLYVEHGDGSYDEVREEAFICFPGNDFEFGVEFEHEGSKGQPQNESKSKDNKADDDKDDKGSGKTLKEILATMNPEQRNAVDTLVGLALAEGAAEEDNDDDDSDEETSKEAPKSTTVKHEAEIEEEEKGMKFNAFEGQKTGDQEKANVLTHEAQVEILKNAKRVGSLREAYRDYAEANHLEHGIEQLEILYPEAKATTAEPQFISRKMDWVSKVWDATKKTPFSRIKSVFADITADEARAKGYIKGKKKLEEQFALLKRVTTPQTVYKLQSMDRDDIIDITDFNVVAWLKAEMRMMLMEELARVILVEDGRSAAAEDKINPLNIRSIYTDDDMYTIKQTVDISATDITDRANAIIDAAQIAQIDYKGSGGATLYAAPSMITTMLLAKDKIGHRMYGGLGDLALALGVESIVKVPVLEGITRTAEEATKNLLGIIVNLKDYSIGADRQGAVTLFDDFDIDYNKYKYLIETRCSGALTVPYSAIALESDTQLTLA